MLQREGSLRARHDDLAQLDIASGAPCEHAGSAGAGESSHRVAADSSGCLGVAGAILNDTAAVCRTAEDFVARADSIQDLQAEKRDMRRLEDVAAKYMTTSGAASESARADRVIRASSSAGSWTRESTFTASDIVWKPAWPVAWRSFSARRWLSLRRGAANMNRGLTPSSQAERQRPEPVHDCAQRAPRLVASPPPRRMSNTSSTTAAGSRVSIPAGPAVGQTSTHRAQRVQRSRISLTLRSSETMNASPRSIIASLNHA